MAPSRRKGISKAAAAAAARKQWKVGDLVLAKVKGFPAWPATVSEPEKWGYSSDWKKVLVYFFGTEQIAFCNPADVEEFTDEKKQSLLGKRHGRSSDFVRAVQEIVDCYDKLRENNRVDEINSSETPAENAVVGNVNVNDNEVPDTTNDSRVKSSNSSRRKDERSLAVEDVGALTEVDSLHKRDVSEEPVHNAAALSMPLTNAYTLRKKSRSVQPQRCPSKKKVSVQRSRSSSRVDLHGLQNGVVKCSDVRSSGEGGTNGFWDGPLRKAKRSKRSPDGCVPNVGDSPICNSNGTVEDNGSEIAMAESENLSNNEGSAIESNNNKRDQSEVLNDSFEAGLELRQRLDLQVNTSVVRKKRNPGRRRALNDGTETILRVDQEANTEKGVRKDTLELPVLCTGINGSHSKDEGDEHLPLVKRARVRMGKLLSEDQQKQLDVLVNSEKSLETVPANTSREVGTSLNSDDHSLNNVITVNEPIEGSPADYSAQVQKNKPQMQKDDSVVSDEQVGCSPVDSYLLAPDDRSQPLKAIVSQQFGFAFDGEAALPPSKRLHRALEAMSANAAEENQTSVAVSVVVPPNMDKEGFHVPDVNTYSNMRVEDEAGNSVGLQNESSTCNNTFNDESSGVPDRSNQPTCEIVMKAAGDVSMLDSSGMNLDSLKGNSLPENAEVAVLSDNKYVICTVETEVSNCVSEEAPQATFYSVDDSEHMLGSVTAVLDQLPLEDLCKAEEEVPQNLLEKNMSNGMICSKRDTKPISGENEAAGAGSHVDTTIDLSDKEAICLTVAESVKTLADEKDKASICEPVEEVKHPSRDADMEASHSPSLHVSFLQRTCDGASVSVGPSQDQADVSVISRTSPAEVSNANDLTAPSNSKINFRHDECGAADIKLPHRKLVSDGEIKSLDVGVNHQSQSADRINLAEVKAAIASLELTLGSLTRTKESIGRATKIAVDCIKFGVAADVVELLVLYLEKESSLYKRVDLFFLVDSIAQWCRGLKGDIGSTYMSAVKETLGRILAAAAPAGQAAKENRRQCLKVLRLWLDRRILPDSIILQHIRELESQNCSTSGYSRRMSRTERSFDDPLRDMEGMLVDEYGSNSSFQLPGFCMPRMLKEEDDGSDSDGGSFEAVTPEHDSGNKEILEVTALPSSGKHRHILEEVDGELEMEDVAPSEVEMGSAAAGTDNPALDTQLSGEQFTSFIPPLPHEVPPRAPPLPSSPPPPPPPPPPPLVSHGSTASHVNVDSQLHVNRNSMQETMASRPPPPGIHHPMPMSESTSSCSYNSYPVMHNPVAPGNNIQPVDANLYGKHYNIRPPYPSPSNQFSYFQTDQQIRPQREVPPPSYYDRPHFGQNIEGGHYYGDQDNIRPPRSEVADGWGYSRPPFHSSVHPENDKGCPPMYSGMSCEPNRPPPNQGWGYPPRPVHHRNHIPNRPPCDGAVPVGIRAPGYWRPR